MSVRAKFRVDSVTETADSATVEMTPVVSGSDENKEFYRWTPSGKIVLSTINKKAAIQFERGGECYVDFTPAPKP